MPVFKKFLVFLWNPKICEQFNKSSPLILILRQMNPLYTLTCHFFKSHYNIILPFTLNCYKWCDPCMFPDHSFVNFSNLSNVLHVLFDNNSLVRYPNIISAPDNNTPSGCLLSWMWELKFHTHTEQQVKLEFNVFHFCCRSMNYCRIFTELAETFLEKIVSEDSSNKPHFAVKILDLVLTCVGHHDYEVRTDLILNV